MQNSLRMATADTDVLVGAGPGAANAEKGTSGGTTKPEAVNMKDDQASTPARDELLVSIYFA